MKECCQNCGLALNLERYFYGPTGCDHDDMPGFVCMAFRDDGVAVWMMGGDVEKEQCEMYRPKGAKYASVRDESYGEDLLELHEENRAGAPADLVEVVRCKDCKHYEFADNRAFGFPVKRCEWTGFEDLDEEDFCSRGERKSDG